MNSNEIVDNFLNFLDVPKRENDISFLNDLIKSHQLKVRWENLTKILDYERGYATGDYIPPIEKYYDRIMNHGYGGTCWTISIGCYWLLKQLGFDVHYLYMDPGHLCLRVNLEQPYYVDLGFGAPLFQAYPLHESFVANDNRETFEYTVSTDSIKIIRNPGPAKTLNTNPVTIEEMLPIIKSSNNWNSSFALKDIMIFGYVENIPTSLTNHTLKQYFPTHKSEQELSGEELEYWITNRFHMNYELYKAAVEIFNRSRTNTD
ncbi:arylamine N-acetyltransferase [Paenibacillus profundus]|uniref:Arylamine N-acetyltransferase n=1 Tax=Paenibacillus profundus TaxID=1173085 RepID=A0ABS8YNJ5_9BACL|nr:arylamine N-acetyltransferase [Paenibacillus profundus]MCE5173381.1 arylamine N-acetyltransferase [Paenibacillus profundus]